MLETKPLELIYQGPTNISQVLSPFSASPPTVLLSGFRSRCHIVIKGAFPAFRVQQGLTQLIHLYTRAGFPKEELQTISDQLLIQHQNLPPRSQIRASRLLVRGSFWFVCLVGFLAGFPSFFPCFCFLSVFLLFFVVCLSFVCLLAASWLNFRLLLSSHGGIPSDGSRSRSCFPSPSGSGSDAFELFGRASSLFRALH